MSKSKRPSSRRISNKRVRSVSRSTNRRRKESIPSKLFNLFIRFLIKCVIVALIILIFLRLAYNLLPEVINFDFILVNKEDLRQEVKELVQQELNSLEDEPNNETGNEVSDLPPSVTEGESVTIAKVPVTSRGSTMSREVSNKQLALTTKATYYHPR